MATMGDNSDRSSVDIISHQKYRDEFEPSVYLRLYETNSTSGIIRTVQCLHNSFLTVPNGVRVLDFGAGPVIASIVSAAAKASSIVLAEYTEKNRKYIATFVSG